MVCFREISSKDEAKERGSFLSFLSDTQVEEQSREDSEFSQVNFKKEGEKEEEREL